MKICYLYKFYLLIENKQRLQIIHYQWKEKQKEWDWNVSSIEKRKRKFREKSYKQMTLSNHLSIGGMLTLNEITSKFRCKKATKANSFEFSQYKEIKSILFNAKKKRPKAQATKSISGENNKRSNKIEKKKIHQNHK